MDKLKFKGSIRPVHALIAVIAVALLVRAYLAPFSAGSDIPQFYGFGNTMLHHPLDFYAYASGDHWKAEGWPYNWPYVYGPALAYFLGFLRLLGIGSIKYFWDSSGYHVYIARSWVVAVKSLFIAADIGIAGVLYAYASRKLKNGWTGVLLAALYLFNPMVIYVSSIYGMFDGMAVLPFLLGIYFLETGNRKLGYFLIGFSLAVKHTILFPAIIVLWDAFLRGRWKGLMKSLKPFLAGIIVPFAPFLLRPSSLLKIPKLMQGMEPGYTYPISYNLNGVVSLLTYVHDKAGIDTMFYMKHWWLFSLAALGVVLFIHMKTRNLELSLALSYTAFLLTYWRVNTQYTLPFFAFMALALVSSDWSTRALELLAGLPATLWPLMFPTSFWFHVHFEKPNWDMVRFIDRHTLMVFDTWPFVELSLIFTFLLFALITWALAATLSGGCRNGEPT
ncbi:hypothetical protein [Thermococcus sp. Bubb.Bath]|uniref:hypothetical protein n=1 Tax=Thermococcus sp. Bubb.Bath TaxID=1638242 RepID=UPI00143974DB|nr:hypothetical protein [Thermococcus sp. Bubb.Bath]NJF24120.1 hypothetical protein [Thermococcus sp. Bubb.Bath]